MIGTLDELVRVLSRGPGMRVSLIGSEMGEEMAESLDEWTVWDSQTVWDSPLGTYIDEVTPATVIAARSAGLIVQDHVKVSSFSEGEYKLADTLPEKFALTRVQAQLGEGA